MRRRGVVPRRAHPVRSRRDADAARAQIDGEARIFGGRDRVGVIDQIRIPTRSGEVDARVYIGDAEAPLGGAVVYFHGGGWVLGGLDSTESACRFIAARTDLAVISVDYRLAPEHPFPAGLEDAVDAYRWVRAHARFGQGPVAVAGDSAGGNLSAAVCAVTLTEGAPDYQLLFFPVTDLSREHRSYELFAEGFFLTAAQMRWYKEHYLLDPAAASDPLVSPLRGDVAGHPPAHVAVSGFDVLRDEGLAYAEKLRAAGVPTTVQQVSGHIHAFVNATAVGSTSAAAFTEAVSALRDGMAAARTRTSGA